MEAEFAGKARYVEVYDELYIFKLSFSLYCWCLILCGLLH